MLCVFPLFGVSAVWSNLLAGGALCYMELVEKDAAGTTRAKIRAMIWSGTLAALRRKFFDATGRDIASGMKVLVRGSASHHSIYGLSFTISDIDPTYTLGDMERVRREILERLTREGIIGRNRQIPLPPVLQRIAVISAEGAAGYGDFINQLAYNPDRFAMYTLLFPAVMQGERTAPTVMAALDRVEMTRDMWDAVAIVRGGGSTTDLNGFDNYELARRVALFPLPVIVGIGHERDRTVLDEIACVRCKTPTAVAAFIIDSMRGAWEDLIDHMNRIIAYGNNALTGEHRWLDNLSQKIPAYARNFILQEKMKLASLSQSVPSLVQGRVMRQHLALGEYASRLGSNVAGRIAAARGSLDPVWFTQKPRAT
ncbi:MAG: exodeoxyribonuclease VII large subunit, partial [Muribaculaceae bacterium]|nr:exodeoxyribonuclease VII large subunit [Muribaculaceae bacterium]